MPDTDRKGRKTLLPNEALAVGWRSWLASTVLAGAGLVAVVATQPAASPSASDPGLLPGGVVLALSLVWLILMGGAVLILRSYCFRTLWDGRPVEPGSYLKGMYQVWGVLVVGSLLAVLGAVLMNTVLPGGLISLVALMLLLFSRPCSKALGV